MKEKITKIETTNSYTVIATFENGTIKEFDVKPYLDKGIFSELKYLDYFKQVRIVHGGIQWPNEQDFSFDTIYHAGKELIKTP